MKIKSNWVKNLIALGAGVVTMVLIWAVVLTWLANNFGERCNKAGYTGAKHEACVLRLKSGGPVYEENIQQPKL